MDIESKTSIYEEKEETQEVNPEEQKSEIKSEKEKDRVLQTAVIVAVAILVIGGITVARRLSNPQKDTKKGTEILKTMDEMDVSKADKKIKELETQEREAEQDAEVYEELDQTMKELRHRLTETFQTSEDATPEELEALDYRSKKALAGQVRIVTFPQADVCACCGTHVVRTGEIGVIKILSVQKFKEGSRVEMLCGSRALTYLRDVFEQNHRISVALSAKPLKTADAVERLKADKEQTDYRLNGLEQTLFQQKAEALTGAGDVILFEKSMAPDSVRKLSVAVMETCGGRCGVFSGDDESGYKYAIGQTEGDLRSWVKMLNQALQGRGGGKGSFVQGSVQAKRAEIQAFWDSQNNSTTSSGKKGDASWKAKDRTS